ncbi:MAG: hypothetical protein KDI77_13740, partial [Gammaproteobacteria bacterium]|nr:hypothetical protein [Gammaproteobacteria bacterium]
MNVNRPYLFIGLAGTLALTLVALLGGEYVPAWGWPALTALPWAAAALWSGRAQAPEQDQHG